MIDPAAAQIRQLHNNHPIVLPQQPRRIIGPALASLAFTAFGVFMITIGTQELIDNGFNGGVVGAFLFGLAAGALGVLGLGGLVLLMVRPSRLVLTAEGFREEQRRHGEWRTTGRVFWSEVTAISITRTFARWPAKGMPVLNYHLTDQGVERIHSEQLARHPGAGARSKRRPPQRITMRTVFGRTRRLHSLFEAAHREFGATFPTR